MVISELNAQCYVLRGYSSQIYLDGYWVVVKFIYLYRISKPSSTATDAARAGVSNLNWMIIVYCFLRSYPGMWH